MVDREYYIKKGMEAARAYLLDKVPLNDSIVKIAIEDGLNPNQVDRIVEYANHSVVATLYKKAKDSRYIQFDVADKRTIRDNIVKTGAVKKQAGLPHGDASTIDSGDTDSTITVDDFLQIKMAAASALDELFAEKKKYVDQIDADELNLKGKMEEIYSAVRSSLLHGEPWTDIRKVLVKNIGEENTAFLEKHLEQEGVISEKEDMYDGATIDTTAVDGNSDDLIHMAEYKLASSSLYGKLVKLAYINNRISETSQILDGATIAYKALSELGDKLAVRGYGLVVKAAADSVPKIKIPKVLKADPEVMKSVENVRKVVKAPGVKKITKLLGGNAMYMGIEVIPTLARKSVSYF